jgi:MFS transporter, DHA1 family, multidrug resistance protein
MWLVVAIMPICGFSVDIYSPSLPSIAHLFHSSHAQTKLTIAIYILGFGIGQLFAGPLSDRLGRRITILSSLLMFTIFSILAAFSKTITFLLLMRFMQGLSVAGQVLNARAILADMFEGLKLRKASIYITTAWTMSPIVGPLIGGYFQTYIGWQASFWFLSAYALTFFIAFIFYLPETNIHQNPKFKFREQINNYKEIILEWGYIRNVLGLTLGFALINVFNVTGPFIIQVHMNRSPLFYSHIALIIGTACFVGSLLNRILVKWLSIDSTISLCVGLIFFASTIGFMFSLFYHLNLFVIVVPILFIIFAVGMIYPNYSANCSSQFKEKAGTAAALRGVITMLGSSFIITLISFLHVKSSLELMLIYSVLAVMFLFLNCRQRSSRQNIQKINYLY